MNFAFLVSGSLGFKILESSYACNEISFVMTDSQSDDIIQFCLKNSINYFVGNPRKNKASEFLKSNKADYLFSINYLFIVEADVFNSIKNYCINFHGSLLPKYRGRTPHVWAIINNEKITGITAHLMTENCDEGDIVYQKKIEIPSDITGGELLRIYMNQYPIIVEKVTNLIKTNSIHFTPQNNTLATWFGKRTAEDGKINWDWQKERIYNWVRAQAHPYPGSFTFLNGTKIIINAISFSEYGFDYSIPYGTILQGGEKPIVKTSNGAIVLENYSTSENLIFLKNQILI